MSEIILVAPCHFGLEAVLKREINDLGFQVSEVEDGRVEYHVPDVKGICSSNIFLRTTERVLLLVGKFKATSFEELFDAVYSLPWENYIPNDGKFWVKKASSVKSKIFSPRDIQSIVKKACVKKLGEVYNIDWFKEDGNEYPIRIFINKDIVTVTLDTTGTSLHKRGYRELSGEAPISETLAAALIKLTPWHKDRILVDPFCGSGTFAIEAAMMAAGIAP
ncbi:MAG: THUMP domain-containing protein, partial [Lachnospiraceae bacterium]|nr:THUMP domain-containing protein [Lachnospiraceae bacterium]